MRSVESSAKTRQEAIKKALDALGVELHEVEIEILDEGSKGLFGFGARDVRVRLTTETPGPEPRRSERREHHEERKSREDRPARDEKPAAPAGPRAPHSDRGARQRQGKVENRSKKIPQAGKAPQAGKSPGSVRQQPPQRREKPPRKPPIPNSDTTGGVPVEPAPAREPLPPISDERREEVAGLLRDILNKMGFTATVTGNATDDGGARLNIQAEDSAILIGRRGNNLEALQYLINRMIASSEADQSERIVVDIEDYLERRKQNLADMARQMAAKAKETSREIRMKPMSAQDRRIVHMALQDDPGIRTFSVGASDARGVVIQPKNQTRDENRSRRQRSGGGRRGGSRRPRRGPRPDNRDPKPEAAAVFSEEAQPES